ncbi:hypothetical protein SeMB42_g07655 [Synchytrium endobioticum]|uniref:Uncharacterized protein n=1 Tax=Synchytrium endobioticum TaxID=286115 RepID=A0A507BSH8_9FUNG|nr:hypothetical protein SeMB42_g07655 [Synchytrium endobioticum]
MFGIAMSLLFDENATSYPNEIARFTRVDQRNILQIVIEIHGPIKIVRVDITAPGALNFDTARFTFVIGSYELPIHAIGLALLPGV